MKQKVFVLAIGAFVGFALPAGASSVFAPAAITTSLDQCESQVCGSNPPLASYTGNLSSFPGTQTVGEGAFVTAAGFPFPTLTSGVPTGGADAGLAAELTYVIELVPNNGSPTVSNVQLGVNASGSLSVQTTGGVGGQNDSNQTTLLFQLESDTSGTPVFIDKVFANYNWDLTNQGVCQGSDTSSVTSTVAGTAVLTADSTGCGSSTVTGNFTDTNSYTISSNSLYLVTLQANLTVGTLNNGDAVGPGTVAGNVSIDPIFTAPPGYTVLLSSGVGNGSTVPEPSTWTMLACGVGLLCAAKRRKS